MASNFSTGFNGTSCMVPPTGTGFRYENFNIKFSVWYDMNAPNTFVSTSFGQGILLEHDIATQQARVLLGQNSCDEIDRVVILPISQVALHLKHKPLSFEEFMQQQQMEQQLLGPNDCGAPQRTLMKRDRESDEGYTHAGVRARCNFS